MSVVASLLWLLAGCRSDEAASQDYLAELAATAESSTQLGALAQKVASETAEDPGRLELVAKGLDQGSAKDMVFLAMLAHYATQAGQLDALDRVLPGVEPDGTALENWKPADKAAVEAVTAGQAAYSSESRAVLHLIAYSLAVNVARQGLDKWRDFNATSPLMPVRDKLHAYPDRKVHLVVTGPDEVKDASPYASAEEAALAENAFTGLNDHVGSCVFNRLKDWFKVSYPLGPLELARVDTPGSNDLVLSVNYSASTTEWVYKKDGRKAKGDLSHGLRLTLDVTVRLGEEVLWEVGSLAAQTPVDFKYFDSNQLTSKGPGIHAIRMETIKALSFELDKAVGRD